jgi:hypothetical protein
VDVGDRAPTKSKEDN